MEREFIVYLLNLLSRGDGFGDESNLFFAGYGWKEIVFLNMEGVVKLLYYLGLYVFMRNRKF